MPKPAPPAPVPGTNYSVLRSAALIKQVDEFARNKAEMDRLEARNAELRKPIEAAMGDSPVAYVGTHVVRVTKVAASPPTANVAITKAMIGQVIPGKKGRAGYIKLEVA